MKSAFGVEHSVEKAYFAAPTMTGTFNAIERGVVAAKKTKMRRVKPKKHPEPDRRDYIAPDGVQVRWRGAVAKSFVPGKGYSVVSGSKGYKRAVDLTHEERAAVRGNPTPKQIKARGGRFQMAARRDAAGKTRKEIWPGIKTPHGKLTKVIPHMREGSGMHPSLQAHAQPNGRGGGTINFYHDTQDIPSTLRHEKAHITPKRNPVRFQERYVNEARRGREEGRADFTAAGKQTTGKYPGGDEFQRGYNEVQGKMAAGAFRRKLRGNASNR